MSQVIAHDLDDKERTADVLIQENYNFDSLLLSNTTVQGLKYAGFYKPSPIQLKAIPLGRCGLDLIVKAKSGTGKTAVFAIIALEMLNVNKNALQVLIFAPTREIAVQIEDVIKTIGKEKTGLEVASFIGGLPLENDIEKIKSCHVAVGAPGRLKHLVEKNHADLKSVRLVIFDEADKLIESIFQKDVNYIYKKLPEYKQVVALSATYTDELKTFLERYMQSPTFVTPEVDDAILLGLRQFVTVVDGSANVVQQMKSKTDELIRLLSKIPFTQCLVFSNFQQRTESISNILNNKGWNSMYISAAQTQVERLKSYDSLKQFKCRILLSTDLTARGIDASNVDVVINYDVPYKATTYLHRMGRAGRYGSRGICITIADDGKELMNLQNIIGEIGGTEFSIAKLPGGDKIVEDIWESNINSFGRIFGTRNVNMSTEAHNKQRELKESVLSVKNKRKIQNESDSVSGDLEQLSVDENEAHQGKHENKELVVENKELDVENVKNLLSNTQKMQKIRKKYSDIHSESLLKSLAAGAAFTVVEGNKKEDENVQRDEAINSILQSLESDVNMEVIENENEADELISPASLYPWVPIEESVLLKATGISLLDSGNETETSDEENLLPSKINKKRKRKQARKPDVPENPKPEKDDLILHKNIALFNVSKILLNSRIENFQSAQRSIIEYLRLVEENDCIIYNKMEKYFDKCTNEDLLKNIVDYTQDWSKACQHNYESKLPDVEEDIFKIAFHTHTKNEIHWTTVLGDKYVEEESEIEEQSDEEEEEDYDEEWYEEEEEDFYEHVSKQQADHSRSWYSKTRRNSGEKQRNNSATKKADYSRRKRNNYRNYNNTVSTNTWSPVAQYSAPYSRNQTFDSYFDYHSQVLAHNALTFENVPSFDNWFGQWQNQVESVRNYVQENIYVQEMNDYQYYKNAYNSYPQGNSTYRIN